MSPGAGRSGAQVVIHVVGDVMLDVVVEVRAPFAHASDTPSVITTTPGGAGANQCVAMARAGASVTLLGVIGNDPFGDATALALHEAGVDVAFLGRTHRPTGVVVALVEQDGQRSMLTDRGANLALDVALVNQLDAILDGGHHVHVSGYCLLDDESRPAGRRALELASIHGASASVDASSAGPLRAVGADRFLDWVQGVDYLFCNEEEAGVLTGGREPSAMARSLTSSAREVVVTLGAEGALVATCEGGLHRTMAVATEVGDTIGAGDSFTAAYLAARLAGEAIAASLVTASAAAARAVAASGARGWS